MQHLHAAHGSCNMMFSRASSNLYWPSYREDINRFQTACRMCRRIDPSNPSQPPTDQPEIPSYPFESVVANFYSLEGRNYLAMADRYYNWLSIMKLAKDDASNLIQALRDYSTQPTSEFPNLSLLMEHQSLSPRRQRSFERGGASVRGSAPATIPAQTRGRR